MHPSYSFLSEVDSSTSGTVVFRSSELLMLFSLHNQENIVLEMLTKHHENQNVWNNDSHQRIITGTEWYAGSHFSP